MKYNIIVSMFAFLFLTACNPYFNTNHKDVRYQFNKKRLSPNQEANLSGLLSLDNSAIQKTSKEISTLTDSGKNKISVSKSSKSVADLSETDIEVKVDVKKSVDNK